MPLRLKRGACAGEHSGAANPTMPVDSRACAGSAPTIDAVSPRPRSMRSIISSFSKGLLKATTYDVPFGKTAPTSQQDARRVVEEALGISHVATWPCRYTYSREAGPPIGHKCV